MTRATVPSRAQRSQRAERRRTGRRVIEPGQRGHGGKRKRPPLHLPPLVLPAGIKLADWAVPVSTAATLADVEYQGLYGQIERRSLPAYIGPKGWRYILLSDLAQSAAGRRQAEPITAEYERKGWLVTHQASGTCTGKKCPHWSHEGEPAPSKRKRPPSAKLLAHLERIRKIAAPINQARETAARVAKLADIAAARLAAEPEAER